MRHLVAVALVLAACGDDAPVTPTCGDGHVDPDVGEQCDDANVDPDDGCEACQLVPIPTTPWQATVVIRGATDPHHLVLTPRDVAVDTRGNVYVADSYRHRVVRIDGTGTLDVVAGNGTGSYGGDNGPAKLAALRAPYGVAVDPSGNVYIADTGNNRIRKVDAAGVITTFAGDGVDGYGGDEGLATAAKLQLPSGVAVGPDGTVYIADTSNHAIRSVDPVGVIHTVAGTGALGFSGDGGPAIAAALDSPLGVAVDEAGALYIADSYNAVVRKVVGGTISTIAGTTALGNTGDGGPATAARLTTPARIAIAGGVLVVADADTQSVRRIDATGTITTIAGTGTGGYGGDGGPAIAAQLAAPQGVALDPMGGVYIADTQNFRVRRIDAAGAMSTVAGTGEFDDVGDGGVATAGSLLYPRGIAIDPVTETVYIADTDHHRIRKVAPDGTISTVAGNGMVGTGGDGGPATAAQVSSPIAVAIAANGELFIAEPTRIRKVDAAGVITTLATGLGFVSGIAAAGNGSAIFCDRDANVVQRVTAAGTITTIVGVGTAGFSGDGGDALLAELRSPDGVFVDGADLVIADTGNRRVRRVSSANTITTIAGDGSIVMGGVTGDGGPAIAASLYPYAAVVAGGALYIADGLDYRVRRVIGGTIATIAGTGVEGARGDGGAGDAARVGFAFDVAAANGNAYVVDNSTFRVRKIASTGAITTFAGRVDPVGAGPVDRAMLVDPRALVETPDGRVVAGGIAGVVQRVRATTVEIAFGRYQQEVPTADLARYRDATFGAVTGLAYDPTSQHLYVAESGNNRIDVVTMVDPLDASTWTIAPLANAAGTNGATDGPALTAQFRSPSGLYLDQATAALYVADTNNHLIRMIDLSTGEATATVSTIAGTAMTPGFAGDGGAATGAQLDTPRALAGCPNGDLYVADTNNHRLRRIAAGGAISTVLGDGTDGTMGEGIPATTIPAGAPRGVACDAAGNVFVTTTETVRYLPADATSHVVDGAGEVQTIFGRDRTTFPASASDCLTGIMVTAGPVLHVVDACAGTLVELRP